MIGRGKLKSMENATKTRHIRKGNQNVKDHRFRVTVRFANKLRPTICGAEPTYEDVSKSDAQHAIKYVMIKPEWSADYCLACVFKLGES